MQMETPETKTAQNSPHMAGCQQELCSLSSDATETLAAWKRFEKDGQIVDLLKHAITMERGRNEWKANHDNQVAIKRIIAARPDLKERAPMVEKLMAERNRAQAHSIRIANVTRRKRMPM